MGDVLILLTYLVTSGPEAAPPAGDKFVVQGPLPVAEVKKVISEQKAAVAACYRKGLAMNPDLAGKVRTSWTIAHDGSTRNFQVHAGSLEDALLTTCLKNAVSAWRFPPPSGAEVLVTYPFNFASRTERVEITRR